MGRRRGAKDRRPRRKCRVLPSVEKLAEHVDKEAAPDAALPPQTIIDEEPHDSPAPGPEEIIANSGKTPEQIAAEAKAAEQQAAAAAGRPYLYNSAYLRHNVANIVRPLLDIITPDLESLNRTDSEGIGEAAVPAIEQLIAIYPAVAKWLPLGIFGGTVVGVGASRVMHMTKKRKEAAHAKAANRPRSGEDPGATPPEGGTGQ